MVNLLPRASSMLLYTLTCPAPSHIAIAPLISWFFSAASASRFEFSSPPSTVRFGSKVMEADRLPVPTLNSRQLNQIHGHIIITHKSRLLNILLGSFTHSSTPQNALLLYNQMLCRPTSHNHYTFTHVLKACSLLHFLPKGLEIHAHALKSAHYADTFIQNCLLHFYIAVDDACSARLIFDLIPSPDSVSWASIISGLSKCGFEAEAIVKFSSMDVKPNFTTLVCVISACSSLVALKPGKAIHGYCVRNLDEDNIFLDNALLNFYVKFGSLTSAMYLFAKMHKRDVVSWAIMIGGLTQRGFSEEAIRLFQEMVQGGEAGPNEATLVNALSACSSLSALSLGRWIHSYVSACDDLTVNGNLGNALINMYVKCSSMGMAVQVFHMLPCKDIISWSTIISGMAMNGHSQHALQLFARMLICGVPPDDVTFIGLLSTCSHGGLVDQGLMFFKAMKDVYKIEPQMKHYNCVVDTYSRAGLLEEAEDFIRKMPMKAPAPIWGSLLNACKIHGNDEMFVRNSKHLHNDQGVSIGTYALLSNTYASVERWDDANKVRDAMRSMGLKKMAGCSWIEVDGLNHGHNNDLENNFACAVPL